MAPGPAQAQFASSALDRFAASSAMRFWVGFAVGGGSVVCLNLWTYFLTRGAYSRDGFEEAGWPWTFSREGGFAYRYEFSASALLADAAVAAVVAVAVGCMATVLPRVALPGGGRGFPVEPTADDDRMPT